MAQVIHPVLAGRKEIAPGVVEIALKSEKMLQFEAGQYIRLTIPGPCADKKNFRDFSITSAPGEETLRFITQITDSGFKKTLIGMPIGTKLKMTGPFGHFLDDARHSRSLVLIAKDIAITPYISLLRYFAGMSEQPTITVLYVGEKGRNPWNKFLASYKKWAGFTYTAIGQNDLVKMVDKLCATQSSTAWYVSGDNRFVEETTGILAMAGVTKPHAEIESPHIIDYQHSFVAPTRLERDKALLVALEKTASVSETDVEGNIIYANDMFCKLAKYSREELIGQNHRIVQSGHHTNAFYKNLWRTISNGRVWRGEIKNRAKDGSHYWVDTTIVPIADGDGIIERYISVRLPVTNRKEFEEKLMDNELKLRALIHDAPEPVLIADLEGVYIDANKAAGKLLGVTPAQIIGKNIEDFIPEDEQYRLDEEKERLLATKENVLSQWNLCHKSGELIPVEANARILGDGRWIAFIRDLSEQKKYERFRDEWIAAVAHDMRQPITALYLAISELDQLRDQLPAKALPLIDAFQQGAVTLQRMTQDLLDAGRVEVGRLQLMLEPVNITQISSLCVETMSHSSGRDIVFNSNFPLDELVMIDPTRIKQALSNLLSNAVRYSKKGTPILVDIVDRYDEIEISVENQGATIPHKELKELFTRFYRTSHGRASSSEGLGLGLYITRGIVKAHRGKITVQSKGGRTTFRITLPIHSEKQA